ncbi:hypothetical protein BU993_01200 [Flavobacterium columnare]|uniref:hypothetical protein n=1 Tax=Flavobacterium columnare TaxID=996 RepID=UPI0007FB1CF7|nr:hypothetical protein [Flavobacterium columnare]APT21372.1 hypothetical protein BU993_01200 [Flavobacterium columnare]
MKKLNLLIILSLFQFHCSFSKTPIKDSEKLVSTCKVWGFLKYYHPNVAKGGFDWVNKKAESK